MNAQPSHAGSEELARVQRAIDRIEERTLSATPGVHAEGTPASAAALEASGLPPAAQQLWRNWDGYEVAGGESRLLPLAQIDAATQAAFSEGVLVPGDRVIGEAGRDRFVLPEDPWAEGADVVRVEEDGARAPEASSAAHLLLGLLVEAAVVYDEDGEFRDDLIGEDAEPTDATQRRLLRRRLDHDADAPRPRLALAQLLRRAGELRAAQTELNAVLKRAPQWCWAQAELGEVRRRLGQRAAAAAAYREAAKTAPEDRVRAHFFACAADCAEAEERKALARRALTLRPDFAAEQERAARALLGQDDRSGAARCVCLGLAVVPTHLSLLALRGQLQP